MRRALLLALVALAGCGGEPAPVAGGGAALVEPGADTGGRAAPPVTPTAKPAPLGGRRAPSLGTGRPAPPRPGGRWATARLDGRVALRSAPRGRAVGAIGAQTQFGGPRVVSVLRRSGAWRQV